MESLTIGRDINNRSGHGQGCFRKPEGEKDQQTKDNLVRVESEQKPGSDRSRLDQPRDFRHIR